MTVNAHQFFENICIFKCALYYDHLHIIYKETEFLDAFEIHARAQCNTHLRLKTKN